MPRVSQFFGITISMFHDDHNPPHFHAKYAEHTAKIAIGTLELTDGKLPRRVLNMVLEWASLHRAELRANWDQAQAGTPPARIEPLD